MAQRARLDAKLRRTLGATIPLPALIAHLEHCPRLRALFENIFSLKVAARQPAGAWARHFSGLLEAAGFPGERP